MKTAKAIRCASCKKRIREHQTDLALEDLFAGEVRYYHDRRGGAAYALAMEHSAAYVLTVRHAVAARNRYC